MKPVALIPLATARHRVTGVFRLLAAFCLASAGAVAQARPQVHPYLELGQVVTADLEPRLVAVVDLQSVV
jgi:hypothetical protein